MHTDLWYHPLVWLFISLLGFGICAFLPVWIKNEKLLKKINWLVLIPVSLILMIYAYPAGLEVFRRLALSF